MRVIFMSLFLVFSTYVGYAAFPIYSNDHNTSKESEECDNIILINGEEIPSKIIEITTGYGEKLRNITLTKINQYLQNYNYNYD